ncbi:MAG: TlpA family protein disulfide reductase [Chloroflexi bacterium]|nr:TlpA family protein disulfide reductase [Chloroflexota bacterium]
MAEQNGNALQHVEQLLREGKKQETLPFLAEHLRQQPNSAHGWWLLSFALPDVKKKIECVEWVLQIDPNSAPARARLEKLKGNGNTSAFVSPFVEEAAPPSPAQPAKQKQNEQPAPRRKKNSRIFQYVALGVMGCLLVGVLGFAAVVIVQSRVPAQPLQPVSFTEISLPPTWTPTPSASGLATQTLVSFVSLQATPTLTATPTNAVPRSQIGPVVGSYAPDFTLLDINTNEMTSLSDYEGQAVIVYFWTTWCPFCEAQMPTVEMLYQRYKDEGLVILAVDVGESVAYALDYQAGHPMSYAILDDAGRVASSQYLVTAYPTYYFVDPSGLISYIQIGILDYWGFDAKVKTMLGLP